MSLLDDEKLVTTRAPMTYGDQLPGKYPTYKDGVEQKWTRRESKAIRGLAAGYSPGKVARECHIKLKTLLGWMGNPYLMMEVQKLADHNVFQYRANVLKSVALRAIEGSAPHARLYMQYTRDIQNDSPFGNRPAREKDDIEGMDPEVLDSTLREELDKLTRGK